MQSNFLLHKPTRHNKEHCVWLVKDYIINQIYSLVSTSSNKKAMREFIMQFGVMFYLKKRINENSAIVA